MMDKMPISQNTPDVSKEILRNNGVKGKNLYRTTSENLADIFNLGLKKGNVIIIDGLKYRFNGKDMFVIDKNAKSSANTQGKVYVEVIKKNKNVGHGNGVA